MFDGLLKKQLFRGLLSQVGQGCVQTWVKNLDPQFIRSNFVYKRIETCRKARIQSTKLRI